MPAPKVRSKDSNQQRLRDRKRQWNSTYREFSQKLKAFKDGLNGRGNAKIGLPPSNIKEPMPTEIGGLLSQLAGEFQQLVGDAESIVSEQEQYSKTRRRRKPKAPSVPGVVPAAPTGTPEQPTEEPKQDKIVDTLSRIGSSKYGFDKEASSKLTRFWQYLSAVFSKKEFNKQRIGLLSQSADLYYSLLDFENDVLSLSISSIPNTVAKYKKFKYNLAVFTGTFDGVVNMVARKSGVKKPEPELESEEENKTAPVKQEEAAPKAEIEPEQPSAPLVGDVAKIEADAHKLYNANLAKSSISDLFYMIKEYKEEDDPNLKSMWEDRLKEFYATTTKNLALEVQKKYGPANIRSVQDIINHVKKNISAELISDYMIKNSSNATTRFLKKQLVKSLSFNKTSPVRLEIVEIIDDAKSTIKNIMDSLEKDLSLEDIKKYIETLEDDLLRVKKPLHVLNVFYMKEFFSKKEKPKQKGQAPEEISGDEELMNYILKRKLKRELSEDLT